MQWTLRQVLNGGVTQLSTYSVNLPDIDLRGIQFTGTDVRFRVSSGAIHSSDRYFEGAKEKPRGESNESSARLPLRPEDRIGRRVASALLHAARSCGAR